MKSILFLLFSTSFHLGVYSQPVGRINGKIVDENSEPMRGANVSIVETELIAVSDNEGKFFFNTTLGTVTIKTSFIGYKTVYKVLEVSGNLPVEVEIKLFGEAIAGNEVVITASRRPEKITNAPAAIGRISAGELEQTSSFNPAELVSKVQGVEFARTGIDFYSINALTAGNQQVFSSRLRHALKISNKWAYKITGEYTIYNGKKLYIF